MSIKKNKWENSTESCCALHFTLSEIKLLYKVDLERLIFLTQRQLEKRINWSLNILKKENKHMQ